MQGRIGADGHIGAIHVVVNGADQAGDGQESVGLAEFRRDFPLLDQLFDEFRPLLAQCIRPGQAAVTANHDQAVDFMFKQVAERRDGGHHACGMPGSGPSQ